MPTRRAIPPWNAMRRLLARRARPLPRSALRRRTVVLAPHPDDEVLGCGGTIIRIRRLGAPVAIVFLTDGEAFHSGSVTPSELAAVRRREANEAARLLGVPAGDLTFLGFPDGSLGDHLPALATRVAEVLESLEPERVFLPSRLEPTPDHRAAHEAIRRALSAICPGVGTCEYPVWAWRHWPWVGLPWEPSDTAKQTLIMAFGLRLLGDLRWQVPIHDLLATKRAALDCHRSQMQRPDGHARWPTLADVAQGGLLSCLLQGSEFFHRRRSSSGRGRAWR